jgi:hypothetical protein
MSRLDWRQVVPALLLGCLLGIWGGHWLSRTAHARMMRRGTDAERTLKRLSSELKLDEQQQAAFKAVLESYQGKVKALHEEHSRRFEELRASMRGDLVKLLDPAQQKSFADIQSRWDSHRKTWALASK